jgi:hypothetical protein
MTLGFRTRTPISRSVHEELDLRTLLEIEKILVAEHEAAMDDFTRSRRNSPIRQNGGAAFERSIVAMQRLGAFMKTREIPADIAARLTVGANKERPPNVHRTDVGMGKVSR